MTTVTIETDVNRICGFTVSGHSGYADAGEDIVCAGISSAASMVMYAVSDVLSLDAKLRVNEQTAEIALHLPEALPERQEYACQTLLMAFLLQMTSLAEDYPEFILVMEVDRND